MSVIYPLHPAPGTVWRNRESYALHRVIYSAPRDIVTHNCEHPAANAGLVEMESWRGTAEEFYDAFEVADGATYPATAQTP
jgi:hypothetical protein